jgi:TolA-binding protein
MRMRQRFFATFLALAAGACLATAQTPDASTNAVGSSLPETTVVAPKPPAKPAKTPHPPPTAQTLAQMQGSLDELTKSNHDLLDLLKQQQAVLEDIQYDRRLQARQIATLEERLEEAMNQKQQLQVKVDKLELQAESRSEVIPQNALAPPTPAPSPAAVDSAGPGNKPPAAPTIEDVKPGDSAAPAGDATPPPPATYLPPEGADNQPGQAGWRRLFTLKGSDNLQSQVFTVHSKVWRVLWHNQDKSGKLYANTSALFINAYPRDDTIPEKIAMKLGTGSDSAELQGPGNFYLKIEASGGSWELAVEESK